jgi:PKD repeat protein
MKKILLTFLVILILDNGLFSQNLVGNPDFEIFGAVPCGWTASPIDFANATSVWTSPTQATPDIFSTLINSSCTNFLPHSAATGSNGWQVPHSGEIFAGFYTQVGGSPWREYLQAQLTQPMIPGEAYRVSLYVSLGDNSQFATNNIGIGFSTTMTASAISNEFGTVPEINFTNVISDTTAWTLLTDTIIATSAWEFMIIGNYFSDANTNIVNFNPGGFWDRCYYYCDDVSVEHILLTPTAIFTAPNDICPGTCTDFTNLSTNAINFQWSFPGSSTPVSTDANPTNICYNTPGNYAVTLIADNGTTSDTLTLNNYITVFPFPAPQGIMQSGDTLFANPGATSYQWYLAGNLIPGATDYFYLATVSGNYNVVATDANGCEVEAVIFDVVAGLTPTLSKGEGVTAFPNPADNQVTLYNLPLGAEISILNLLGETIYRERANDNFKAIDLTGSSSGVYIVNIASDQKEQRIRLIKD